MAASEHNFSIDQGSSFSLVLTNKDSDGNVVDITGYCARLIMTTSAGNTHIFDTENVDYSQYKFTIDGPLGKITLLIPASSTNAYTFNSAKYDLELQSPDDHYVGGGKYTERLLYGLITINKRFSKSTTLLDCSS